MLLPSFVSHQDQRRLTKWALADHARPPNDTNLDTHYVVPPEGLWNAAQRSDPVIVQPRAQIEGVVANERIGPRQLIENEAASPDNFEELVTKPKPPAPPSASAQPALASALVPKLRWANIGWYYHWGTKQYDFTKGKVAVDPFLRDVCKQAVRSVPWDKVYGREDSGWGDHGPDWHTWEETYGKSVPLRENVAYMHQNRTLELSTFIKKRYVPLFSPDPSNNLRTPSWPMSTAPKSAQHLPLSPYRTCCGSHRVVLNLGQTGKYCGLSYWWYDKGHRTGRHLAAVRRHCDHVGAFVPSGIPRRTADSCRDASTASQGPGRRLGSIRRVSEHCKNQYQRAASLSQRLPSAAAVVDNCTVYVIYSHLVPCTLCTPPQHLPSLKWKTTRCVGRLS